MLAPAKPTVARAVVAADRAAALSGIGPMSEQDTAPPGARRDPVAQLIFVRVPYLVIGTLLYIAIVINFANVIARYFFFEAFYWAEETLIYITLWGVILATATITYQGLHIKMDLFSVLFRSPIKEIIGALTALLMICASVYVVIQSYQVVGLFVRSGEVSIAAGVPLTIPHIAVPIGFGLTALAVIVRLRAYITGRFE
jgi:TRAP-type C4-dicarboxylate transport system permease small subunit